MNNKTLFIDGDGCNQYTRSLAERLGNRGVRVMIVANRTIGCAEESTTMIVCSSKTNAADEYIIQHCKNGDLVITRDLALVSLLLQQSGGLIHTISDNGELYTIDMIEARQARAKQSQMRRDVEQLLDNTKHKKHNKKLAQNKNIIADYLERWRLDRLVVG